MTQLTSTTEAQLREEQNIQTSIEEAVLHYARLTHKAGLDGVVCSPLEAELISQELGPEFMKVTPELDLKVLRKMINNVSQPRKMLKS